MTCDSQDRTRAITPTHSLSLTLALCATRGPCVPTPFGKRPYAVPTGCSRTNAVAARAEQESRRRLGQGGGLVIVQPKQRIITCRLPHSFFLPDLGTRLCCAAAWGPERRAEAPLVRETAPLESYLPTTGRGNVSSAPCSTHTQCTMGERNVFDPKLILYQIVALQSFYYLVFGAILTVSHSKSHTHSMLWCGASGRWYVCVCV